MNNCEKTLDPKEILGCSYDEVKDLIDTVYLMTWEQVLLVPLYTRQQFFYQKNSKGEDKDQPDDPISFSNKMKLISALFKSNKFSDEFQNAVLEKIERYEDIHSITSYLLNLEVDSLKEQAKILLNIITTEHITFSGNKSYHKENHPYTYKTMNNCLYNIINIFQFTLNLSIFNENIEDVLLKALKYAITGDRQLHLSEDELKRGLREKTSLESALIYVIENFNNEFDKNLIKKSVHIYLSKEIGNNISKLFQYIENGNVENVYRVKNFFEKAVNVRDDNNNKIIEIDKKIFKNLVALGQFKSVMDAIEHKLNNQYFRYENDDLESLEKLKSWYLNSKTGLLRSKRNIPSLVASILYFDVFGREGSFDMLYGLFVPIRKKGKIFIKDYYLLVTGIIYRFLYKYDFLNEDLRKDRIFHCFNKDEYLDNIEDFIMCQYDNKYTPKEKISENLDNIKTLHDPIMSDWSVISFDEGSDKFNAMVNRFKKLPNYLNAPKFIVKDTETQEEKRKEWDIGELIALQRWKKNHYPINSSFPLPLWVDMSMKGEIEN